ncbi:MAG: glycosyltransferase family 4 protein [Bacteroidales bacterium]|nr:glycosyltransferase family 4 protein [Bacteroidales bacterium]
MKRKRILYIARVKISFSALDHKVLTEKYEVITYVIDTKRTGAGYLLNLVSLAFFILSHARHTDAMVTWFGDYHSAVMSFFGKLLHIKVIIFAGGQEAICYPLLRKGVYLKKWRGRMVKYALRHATHIIPNHASLIYHENYYYDPDGKKDGIKYYIPDIKTPMTIIPNGINTEHFYRDPSIAKEPDRVLTVGTMGSVFDFLNKGFDLFSEMARRNPDLKFTMIGINRQLLPWIEENYGVSSIPNLELVFFNNKDEEQFKNYNRAKVFVQASITEGMPNTLGEAMACECIPVGSNVNGIPDAIGDTGVLVYHRSVAELEQAVRKALKMDTGKEAREQVMKNFTYAIRKEKILDLLEKIL